jgi:hypothetical protein
MSLSLGATFVISLIRLAATSVRLVERHQWIAEGERRYLLAEALAVSRALNVSLETRKEVDNMTEEEVDAALRGDYRP